MQSETCSFLAKRLWEESYLSTTFLSCAIQPVCYYPYSDTFGTLHSRGHSTDGYNNSSSGMDLIAGARQVVCMHAYELDLEFLKRVKKRRKRLCQSQVTRCDSDHPPVS